MNHTQSTSTPEIDDATQPWQKTAGTLGSTLPEGAASAARLEPVST